MADVKENYKVKHSKKKYVLFLVLALLCLVGSVLISGFLYQRNIQLDKTIIENDKSTQAIITEKNKIIQELIKKSNKFSSELEAVKRRVENIKTLDDLLERDIKLYIKTHYKKVPTSVAKSIAFHIIKFGKQYKISPVLLVGIMQVESGFNPMITGPKTKYGNARGLMQVMPEWVKKLGLKSVYNLYDIDVNIESGCKVFNIHLKEGKGSISKGLYLYVNKNKQYVVNVFTSMGKFVAFRSTVEVGKDEVEAIPENGKEEKKEIKTNVDKPAKSSTRKHIKSM